jgi:hypothetical protein
MPPSVRSKRYAVTPDGTAILVSAMNRCDASRASAAGIPFAAAHRMP